MSNGYTELNNYRFERKFVAPNMSRLATEMVIKQNQAFFNPVYQPRRINNIYFDTPGLDCFFDNLFGNGNRWKCRLRWYGDVFGKIEMPVLEFKIKKGLVGTKRSFRMPAFNFDKHQFTFRDIEQLFEEAALPHDIRERVAKVQPVLLNSYNRSYFVSMNKRYRITVDDKLQYYNLRRGWNHFGRPFTEDFKTVVELKYDQEWNKEVDMITNQFPFRLDKNSKFLSGMSHFRSEIAV
ncbi:VTC domain-containing protein [uncultured Draconibacterium sp.]|uniref:VTC domain-containing protein n=1 Tax=uncultured Draconibacterium sp. TaxID=1573823 RepID=UPI0029C85A1E|nr:VTC domain-containing protein [uncultured Draconibacterium sp.]